MENTNSYINVYRESSIIVMELARPEVFNCLSLNVYSAISEALREAESDTSVKSVLICAQGKHFCTGADLGEVKEKRQTVDGIEGFVRHGHDVLKQMEASRLPIICAVQGLCLAGGLELMLACDVAFASSTAKFGDQHAQFGLVPGWGSSQRLPRVIGQRRAMDLFFSVRWIDAQTAETWGLVNYVTSDESLREEALAYCAKLADRSSVGLAAMKDLAISGLSMSLEDGLEYEIKQAIEPLMSPHVTEGIAAFEEKRKPNFH